uniref:C-type lectin domain family 4 member M-like n=1 Tax=Saccoglossus kowalevskii TaxID=10224 RepID=A0ABM0MYJ7_SACKO|nr:PREDICTED: C-type lectin domain family 4 member M-like [Saccoglossus kowalevskii]
MEDWWLSSGHVTSRDTALTTCTDRGSGWYIATIQSTDDQDWLELCLLSGNSWVGATDESTEGTWIWEDGTQVADGLRWHNGLPVSSNLKNCVYIKGNGNLVDDSCMASNRKALCRKTRELLVT